MEEKEFRAALLLYRKMTLRGFLVEEWNGRGCQGRATKWHNVKEALGKPRMEGDWISFSILFAML
jgi:hypothetical protein